MARVFTSLFGSNPVQEHIQEKNKHESGSQARKSIGIAIHSVCNSTLVLSLLHKHDLTEQDLQECQEIFGFAPLDMMNPRNQEQLIRRIPQFRSALTNKALTTILNLIQTSSIEYSKLALLMTLLRSLSDHVASHTNMNMRKPLLKIHANIQKCLEAAGDKGNCCVSVLNRTMQEMGTALIFLDSDKTNPDHLVNAISGATARYHFVDKTEETKMRVLGSIDEAIESILERRGFKESRLYLNKKERIDALAREWKQNEDELNATIDDQVKLRKEREALGRDVSNYQTRIHVHVSDIEKFDVEIAYMESEKKNVEESMESIERQVFDERTVLGVVDLARLRGELDRRLLPARDSDLNRGVKSTSELERALNDAQREAVDTSTEVSPCSSLDALMARSTIADILGTHGEILGNRETNHRLCSDEEEQRKKNKIETAQQALARARLENEEIERRNRQRLEEIARMNDAIREENCRKIREEDANNRRLYQMAEHDFNEKKRIAKWKRSNELATLNKVIDVMEVEKQRIHEKITQTREQLNVAENRLLHIGREIPECEWRIESLENEVKQKKSDEVNGWNELRNLVEEHGISEENYRVLMELFEFFKTSLEKLSQVAEPRVLWNGIEAMGQDFAGMGKYLSKFPEAKRVTILPQFANDIAAICEAGMEAFGEPMKHIIGSSGPRISRFLQRRQITEEESESAGVLARHSQTRVV